MSIHYCMDCEFLTTWSICVLIHELKTNHVIATIEHGTLDSGTVDKIRRARAIFNEPDNR